MSHKKYALVNVGFLLPGRDGLDGVSQPVHGGVQLGPEPAPEASQRLVGAPFFAAPAKCWWVRIMVLPRMSHTRSGSFNALKTHSQTPLADQRSNRLQIEFQFPKRSGRSRHGAPVLATQRTALTKRRLPEAVTPGSSG